MTTRRKKNKSIRGIIFLIVALVVVVAAYMTNPNINMHRETMRQRTTKVMNEVVAEQNMVVQAGWHAGGGNRLMNEFINQHLTTQNYLLFSITKLNWDNQSYSIGIGVFGNVFISRRINKELVYQIIDEARNDVRHTIPMFLRIILQQ